MDLSGLNAGKGIFFGGTDGPLFVRLDGAVLTLDGGMILPPDAGRAATAAAFSGLGYTLPVAGEELGGVKNGGNVTANAAGELNYTLAAAGEALGGVKNGGNVTADAAGMLSVPGLVLLLAVTDTAPETAADGDKYANTTDKAIYVRVSGAWTAATGDDVAKAGVLYAASGLLWHFDGESGFSKI